VFAARVLHGGPHTLGTLMAAIGVGALAGVLALAGRQSVIGLGKVIPVSGAIFGLALIGFGLSKLLWLSVALLLVTGFGMMRHMAASNTILQTIVEDEKRGRAMSFYAMALAGMSPFGSLLAGLVASRLGAPNTVALSGAICVVGALVFARQLPRLRELIRPIYRQLGILPVLDAEVPGASTIEPVTIEPSTLESAPHN
jgi:MFS family permease